MSSVSCRSASENTQPRVYANTDNFAELLLNSDVFVDKSLFIREFLTQGDEVTSITRPRCWGKSLNLDMLRRFLAIEPDEQGNPIPQEESLNHKLFVGGEVVVAPKTGAVKKLAPLKIAQQYPNLVADYQGAYPVISFSFKDILGSSYQKVKDALKKQVTRLYREHAYLEKSLENKDATLPYEQKQLRKYMAGDFSTVDL